MNNAAVRKELVDDWMLKQLSIPNHLTRDGRRAYNTLLIGSVGTGKTMLVKQTIQRLEADGYAIIILDVEDEYDEYPGATIRLPDSLLNTDTLSVLLGTDAAYLDLVAEFLHVSGDLDDYIEEHGISGQQLTFFQRAVKKIRHLAENGEDLIESINRHQTLRISLDPNYGAQQIIVLTRHLTKSCKQILPTYTGVVVILEENERLASIDKAHQIPHAIFAGRKRGIYYIVVGHTPIRQLQQTEWGMATVKQFDNIVTMGAKQ